MTPCMVFSSWCDILVSWPVSQFLRSRQFFKLVVLNKALKIGLQDRIDLSDIDSAPYNSRR